MTKKLLYQIPLLLFMWLWLILDCGHPWIKWPKIVLFISAKQEALANTISISTYLGNWSVFFYFTLIVNILIVIVMTMSWVFKFKFKREFKLFVTVYAIITFGVFWTSLAPFLPWGQNWFFDYIFIYEHLIVFIFFGFWLWESETNQAPMKHRYWKLFILPVIYLTQQIIFYIAVGGTVATYPFLHFSNFFDLQLPLGWSIILSILSIVVIALTSIGIYWSLERLHRLMKERGWLVK